MTKFAIICGSDLRQYPGFEIDYNKEFDSQYGFPSTPIFYGNAQHREFLFLVRHGLNVKIAPDKINYRANIDALKKAGAEAIITINTVGSMNSSMAPGSWVLADQLIDYTYGREHTFFDGVHNPMQHIDFSFPFSGLLRKQLQEHAEQQSFKLYNKATYACTQGPRLETAAEIQRLKRDGNDIVGMTAMPEAVLAREAGIPYASLCLVANWGAGIEHKPLDIDEIYKLVEAEMANAVQFVSSFIAQYSVKTN